MSIPKEAIWQGLRHDCLDAIPLESRANHASPATLAAWQSTGSYTVTAVTSKRFHLAVSPVEIGGALLTDAECLLDSATEHQVFVWRQIQTTEWFSPAWLGVTVYYWAFYVSLAMSRLTGRTAWWLTKESARKLATLAPTPTAKPPGAGCFRLRCENVLSLSEREVTLEKSDARVHEEVWRLWFDSCAARFKQLPPGSNKSAEARLFKSLSTSAAKLGNDWPSTFRNAINYSPGFAYTAVRREKVLKSFGHLKSPNTYDFLTLLSRFETSLDRVKDVSAIRQQPQDVLDMLVYLTFIIHAIATDLHDEAVDRHGFDKRWRTSRRHFVRTNGLCCDEGVWPM